MRDIERKIVKLEERLNVKDQFPQPGITYVLEFTSEEDLQEKLEEIRNKYGEKALGHILFAPKIEKPKDAGLSSAL